MPGGASSACGAVTIDSHRSKQRQRATCSSATSASPAAHGRHRNRDRYLPHASAHRMHHGKAAGIMLMMPDMPRPAVCMLTIRRRRRPAELDRQQHQQRMAIKRRMGQIVAATGRRASCLTAGANYRTCPASPVPIASQPGPHTNAGAACKASGDRQPSSITKTAFPLGLPRALKPDRRQESRQLDEGHGPNRQGRAAMRFCPERFRSAYCVVPCCWRWPARWRWQPEHAHHAPAAGRQPRDGGLALSLNQGPTLADRCRAAPGNDAAA